METLTADDIIIKVIKHQDTNLLVTMMTSSEMLAISLIVR